MNYLFPIAPLAVAAAIQTSTARINDERVSSLSPMTSDQSAGIASQMLPVRSALLSPGDEPRRAIRAPGLAPFFLVGDDDRSRAWLQERGAALQRMQAVGLVVNVARPQALAALRRLVPELSLMPVSGDDLARRLGIHHYPLLITADGIEP